MFQGEGSILCGLAYLAPAPSTVVSHNRSNEINKCLLIDALILVNLDASCRGIVLALVYQSSWIWRDGVVNKNIHMIFGGEKCTNVAIERKVWTVGKFDRFSNLWLCLVNERSYLIANCLLPIRERVYIFIDAWVFDHCRISSLNRDYSNHRYTGAPSCGGFQLKTASNYLGC